MNRVAVFGAGSLGGAIAHRLAEHNRIGDVLLIDGNVSLAEGKALDIRQAGPIAGADTVLGATSDPLAAVGAGVIVLADDSAAGVWDGERGLALIERLLRAGSTAAFVFAGPTHLPLMETAARELHVPGDRLIGTAASAVQSIAASLVHIELAQTGAAVGVTGRPPEFVVGWSAATIAGALVGDVVPPHRLLAISQSLRRFWPPGPQAIAAPTVSAIEALMLGSRRLLPVAAIFEGELGVRGRAGLVTAELGNGR